MGIANRMKKVNLTLLLCFFIAAAFSQALFNNNGADIYVKDGGFMIIKTNSLHNNLSGGAGKIDNQGTIVVEGNVINDAPISGNGDTIKLLGDWINDNAYTGSSSWVDMYGGNQKITGTAVTTFDNLNLGGGAVVKQQTIDAITAGQLQLNDAELATDANEMLVSNTALTAITRNNGFASSLGTGKLSRATDISGVYFFPVGSPSYNNAPSIFRPIEMTPVAAAANIYGACLVKGDATNDGYDVNTLDDVLCKVNPNFYHRLYHNTGSDATALAMFYDPATDGDWTDQGHWKGGMWNYIAPATAGTGNGFSSVSVASVSDFAPEPFALARKKFTVNAGPDVTITEGQSTIIHTATGASGATTIAWAPTTALSCDNCANPTASPLATTRYVVTVTDPAGCKNSDSLLVTVTDGILLVPTGFSPNNDGENDLFRVLNKNLGKFDLQVFNRWGELLYETSDPTEGWDGTYKNMKQEVGVYVWQCTYVLAGDPVTKFAKGNVTLIR